MLNPLRFRVTGVFTPGPNRRVVAAAAIVLAVLFVPAVRPLAQQAPAYLHLNPVIDKLVQGKQVFGVQTLDLSPVSARALARSDIDYVYIDFEHLPMNFSQLEIFMTAMVDKEAALKKGNAQPNVAVFARFAPYASELGTNMWVIKQALDLGLMGIFFQGIETKEQALKFVAGMRRAPMKGEPYTGPIGTRGTGGGPASFFWGVSGREYSQRIDLWPLNPKGDLLMMPMFESIEGIRNAEDIASVPGIGALYVAQGGDTALSMGVGVADPAVEEARQQVLKTCLKHNIPCGGSLGRRLGPKGEVLPYDIETRIKQGFKIHNIGTVTGGLDWEMETTLRRGRAAARQ